jgi:ATP-binding cassette subfamily B protein
VDEGREIVREGDAGDRFYMVARGKVEITKTNEDGSQRRVTVLENGDYFGEIALLENRPRTASVRALQATTLLVLHRARLLELMQRLPELRTTLVAEADKRSRSLVEPA